jgi:hypothetical protein
MAENISSPQYQLCVLLAEVLEREVGKLLTENASKEVTGAELLTRVAGHLLKGLELDHPVMQKTLRGALSLLGGGPTAIPESAIERRRVELEQTVPGAADQLRETAARHLGQLVQEIGAYGGTVYWD